MIAKLCMEALGTFFLVLAIALTGDPLAIGSMLMVMIYMGGHVSWAHYNPAVTLWVWIRGKIWLIEWGKYILAQIVGAFLAVAIAVVLWADQLIPAPAADATWAQILLAEALFTFVLVSVILHVATAKDTAGNSYYGLAIWFTVMAAAFSVGGLSGGAFNPAVGLWPWLFDMFTGWWFAHIWMYIVAPLVWWAVAGWLFNLFHSDQ